MNETQFIKMDENLSHAEDNLLLWLDNEESYYQQLQQINEESINEYQYTNPSFIKKMDIVHKHNVAYRNLLQQVFDDIYDKEYDFNRKDIDFRKLASYLYLRELREYRFNCETKIRSIDFISQVIGDLEK